MTGMTDVSRHGGDKKNRNEANIKVRDDALVDFNSDFDPEEPDHDLDPSPSSAATLVDDSDDDTVFDSRPGTATKVVQFAVKMIVFPIILLYRGVVSVRHAPWLCGKIWERAKRWGWWHSKEKNGGEEATETTTIAAVGAKAENEEADRNGTRHRWHWRNWGWKKRDSERKEDETVHETRSGTVVANLIACLITVARYTGIFWVSRKCSALANSYSFWRRTRHLSAEERTLEREIRAEEIAKRNQTPQNAHAPASVTQAKPLSQQQQLQQAKTSLAAKVYSQHQQSQAGQNEAKSDKISAISAAFRSPEAVTSRSAATPQTNADYVDDQTQDPFAEQSHWGLTKSSMFALACLLLIGVCFYGGKYILRNGLGTVASRNNDDQSPDQENKTPDNKETKPAGGGYLPQNTPVQPAFQVKEPTMDQTAAPSAFGTLSSSGWPGYDNAAAAFQNQNNAPEQNNTMPDEGWTPPPAGNDAPLYAGTTPDTTLADSGTQYAQNMQSVPESPEPGKTFGFHVSVEPEPVGQESFDQAPRVAMPGSIIPQQTFPQQNSQGYPIQNNGITYDNSDLHQQYAGVSPQAQENPLAVTTTGTTERQATTRPTTGPAVVTEPAPQAMFADNQATAQQATVQTTVPPYTASQQTMSQQTMSQQTAENPLVLPTENQNRRIRPQAIRTIPNDTPATPNETTTDFMAAVQMQMENTNQATSGMGLERNDFNRTSLVPPVVEENRSFDVPSPTVIVQTPPLQHGQTIADNAMATPPVFPSVPQPRVTQDARMQVQPVQNPVTSQGYRDYEVKPGDSIYRIAKRELNNVLRFREIYELNQDKLPRDQHKLTPGTILRLPPADVSNSANGNLNSIGSTNGAYLPQNPPGMSNDQGLPIF